jgi:hypothetical protein
MARLIVRVKSVREQGALFLQEWYGVQDCCHNGDNHRRVAGFVNWGCHRWNSDSRNENECRELQIPHIPVKKLE